jgi:hypothetical protein
LLAKTPANFLSSVFSPSLVKKRVTSVVSNEYAVSGASFKEAF